jgi:hypothetical protein
MKITTLSQRQVQREARESLAALRADTPPLQQQVALAADRERTIAVNDILVTTHPRKTRYQLAPGNCDLREDDAGSKLPVGALEAAENEGLCLSTPQPDLAFSRRVVGRRVAHGKRLRRNAGH